MTDTPGELRDGRHATMLGLSKRQVQRIAHSLDGRLAAGRWVFDRNAVTAYQAHRSTAA